MPNSTRNTPQKTARPSLLGGTEIKGLARLHAVAAAALLCTGLLHFSNAQAMALGRLTVQSPLGAPLRAEIEVLEVTQEESDNLKVGIGSTEAFKAAGMEFNTALGNVTVTLQRRPNGQAFLKLAGTRPVNEPFIDVVLEGNWNAERVTRSYTLLFDPPNLRPDVSSTVRSAAATPANQVPAAVPRDPSGQPQNPQPQSDARNDRFRVNIGDTAGGIAASNLPANISLDQMLVAMLRNNPQAFIKGNINLIKAGAVLALPSSETASVISSGEARQIISAQSRDFNDFRRRLADRVPDAPAETAEREATGQIQAEVKDQKPAAIIQDKLTIAKGATPGQSVAEDKIAKDRQAEETANRTAELARNIEELSEVGKTTIAAGGASAAPTAIETAAETEETVPTDAVAEAAPIPKPAIPPAPVAPSKVEASFIDQLLENPLGLPLAGGLLALLAGLGIYGFSRRRGTAGVDSSFLESRVQSESLFAKSDVGARSANPILRAERP